ncbi:MAG: tetratricopeptide repeat protein [Lysobacterales bacterium]
MTHLVRRFFVAVFFLGVFASSLSAQEQTVDQLQAALDDGTLTVVEGWLEAKGKTRLSPQQRYIKGQYLLRTDKPKEALKDLEAAAKAFPENENIWLSVAEAAGDAAGKAGLMSAGGLAKTARKALDRVVALNPQNLSAREGLIQFHTQAPWVMGGRTKEAYRQAEAIGKIDSVRGRSWKARIDLIEGDTDAAETTFRSILAQNPTHEGAGVGLATLLQQEEQWSEAIQVLTPLAQDDPPNLIAVYQIGRTGALSGEFLDTAETSMRRYLALAEKELKADRPIPLSPAWWRLGMVLQHQEKLADAKAAYQKALSLDPDNDTVKKALKALPTG